MSSVINKSTKKLVPRPKGGVRRRQASQGATRTSRSPATGIASQRSSAEPSQNFTRLSESPARSLRLAGAVDQEANRNLRSLSNRPPPGQDRRTENEQRPAKRLRIHESPSESSVPQRQTRSSRSVGNFHIESDEQDHDLVVGDADNDNGVNLLEEDEVHYSAHVPADGVPGEIVFPSIEGAHEPPVKKPRKVRKDKGVPRKQQAVLESEESRFIATTPNEASAPPNRSSRTRSRRQAAQPTPPDPVPVAAPPVQTEDEYVNEDRPKRRRRRRTPDGAETAEIATGIMTMTELCRDSRVGKKSSIEERMQAVDWTEVARRRREEKLERAKGGRNGPDTSRDDSQRDEEGATAGGRVLGAAPSVQIVNGIIEHVRDNRRNNRHARAEAAAEALDSVEEDDYARRVNTQTYAIKHARGHEKGIRGQAWTNDQTDAFYDALAMFGTDFYTISTMFPGKTRRQIKAKFVKEERMEPQRITMVLKGVKQVKMNIDLYAEAAGRDAEEFKNPEELAAEMAEEEKRQNEEIERGRLAKEEAQRNKEDRDREAHEQLNSYGSAPPPQPAPQRETPQEGSESAARSSARQANRPKRPSKPRRRAGVSSNGTQETVVAG